MLVPSPKRILQLIAIGGATLGFFKYFRVDGLDGVTLALRDQILTAPANPQDPSSTMYSSVGGTAANPFVQDSKSAMNSLLNQLPNPFANANTNAPLQAPQSNGNDLWAAQSSPHVQNAKYLSNAAAVDSRKVRLLNMPLSLRVGAFALPLLDMNMVRDPFISDRVAQILSEYGCVAVQFVDASNRMVMPELMKLMNANGRHFEYIDGSVNRATKRHALAIVFDAEQLQVDRYQSYALKDESGTMTCEPLVAWFRSLAVDPKEAFTFTFVNAYLTAGADQSETHSLPDIFTSIFGDGRSEDDIILAGSIANEPGVLEKMTSQGFRLVPDGVAMQSSGQIQAVMMSAACREYMGNSGEFSILRRYNLTPDEANAISEVSPVWADFEVKESSIY